MENIVFLDRITLPAPVRAPAFAHEWNEYPLTDPSQVHERVANATMIITNKVRLTPSVLAAAPRLKFVAACATGTNHIDLDACRRRAIPISNIRDYATQTVPEHVLMLLLALSRNLMAYRRDLQAGAWQKSPTFCLSHHPIRDLCRMTLAVVGTGALGEGVARSAAGVGMRVWRVERKHAERVRDGYVAWERALREADAITLHCPLTPDTHHLIGEAELQAMRPGALLINTGRGGLVDEAALAQALLSGRLGGAGLDVLSEEPPPPKHPLLDLDLPNLIVTPHNAWTSQDAVARMAEQLIGNLEAFASGAPRHLVA